MENENKNLKMMSHHINELSYLSYCLQGFINNAIHEENRLGVSHPDRCWTKEYITEKITSIVEDRMNFYNTL